MELPKRGTSRAFEVSLIGAFMAFTGWALVSFVLTFRIISIPLENLENWTRAAWALLFLTLLLTLIVVGVGSWRRLPDSEEDT